MDPTDTTDPNYFLKVVDCQYACPAHTNVPEYIRLIAQGEYTKAYLANRNSNVFPGILGRVCDRPCEPACRRGRVEEKPVAICRLKRAAADFKEQSYKQFLPKIPLQKNGKRIALIGAGPASLTVANDLMPLGYAIDLYEKESKPGGAMLTQVPAFRLPQEVLDEEIGNILEFGVNCFWNHPVSSLSELQTQKQYDAIFVGVGAPIGKDLNLPGRKEADEQIHVGLEFLANVTFEHKNSIGKKVLIIGGGNTAMDCCRTSLRLGASDVVVAVPETFDQMLASPWEKEEALHEGVEIQNLILPKSFVHENGKLKGVKFQPLNQAYNKDKQWDPHPNEQEEILIACDEVVLAIGQTTSYPFIEDQMGIEFTDQGSPKLDPVTYQSSNKRVFFGGDAAFGPKNIIWAVRHGHEAALSMHLFCKGEDINQRLPIGMNLVSQKMSMNQWSYGNDYNPESRQNTLTEPMQKALASLTLEAEKGFDPERAWQETQRCLNCDVQTVFESSLCIECDACVDICPVDCLSMPHKDNQEGIEKQLKAPRLNNEQDLFLSNLPQTNRFMAKDENLCLHCGLCAERCPTGAWDMQQFISHIPKAEDASS